MMVMTAKVDFKKIALGLIAAIGVIVLLIMLLGGGNDASTPTAAGAVSNNDARVKFLTDFGWDVSTPNPVRYAFRRNRPMYTSAIMPCKKVRAMT